MVAGWLLEGRTGNIESSIQRTVKHEKKLKISQADKQLSAPASTAALSVRVQEIQQDGAPPGACAGGGAADARAGAVHLMQG